MNISTNDITLIGGIIGGIWIVYQFTSALSKSLDAKIASKVDRAIDTKFVALDVSLRLQGQDLKNDVASINDSIKNLELRLPKLETVNDHENRVCRLESKMEDFKAELGDVQRRLRKNEISIAKVEDDSDTTEIPIATNPPPRPR